MICRLCLIDLNTENSVALFNDFGSNDNPQLIKVIVKYLHLEITWSDEISTAICQDCCKHLIEFDKYCFYIEEQQIMLNQREPVVDDQKAAETMAIRLSVGPMEVNVKNEPEENAATMEIQSKCVVEEDFPAADAQFKCEPEEADLTEMTLMYNNHSADRDWGSSLCQQNISDNFHQTLGTRNIDDSSTNHDFMSDKQSPFIPDAISLKELQPLQNIYKSFSLGNPLADMDRTAIVEAVIEECLKKKPEKVLKCNDFGKLAENIIEIFPSENVSTYYLCHTSRRPASGKLFYAYNKHLAYSVETKVKIKSKTKKKPMTSAERTRKHRARKYQLNHTKNLKIISSAGMGDPLAAENIDTHLNFGSVTNQREKEVAMDVLTRTKTKTKTKKKTMTSTERSRIHRARKYHLYNMENMKTSSSASIDDSLALQTSNIFLSKSLNIRIKKTHAAIWTLENASSAHW